MTQLRSPLLPASPIQAPDRCPYCNSARLRPKGRRIKKLETVKQHRCESCGRTSLPGPRALRNKTYPIHEILEGISLYNEGHSLDETAKKRSSRHGHPVDPSSISRWLSQHPALTTYRRLRDIGRKRFHSSNVMPTTKLYHAQVYEYSWHRAKLDALRDGSLDPSRSRTQTKFANVANFLEAIPKTCPHDLFRREDGTRGSRLPSTFVDADRLIVTERRNTATDTAALIIPSVGSNHQRHARLQRFMLTNDACTLAVEVPIWLDEAAIAELESLHDIILVPKHPADPIKADGPHKPRHLTGTSTSCRSATARCICSTISRTPAPTVPWHN